MTSIYFSRYEYIIMSRRSRRENRDVIWNRPFHLPQQLKALAVIVGLIFVVGVAGFTATKGISLEAALLDTVYSISFIEIEIPNAGAQVVKTFIAFLGVIAFWWALWNILDFLMEGRFTEYLGMMRMSRRVGKMHRHYVICGAGRVGEHVASLMNEKNLPYVLIDNDAKKVQALQDSGLAAMYGDALDEAVLLKAGLKKSRAVIAALPETEKNIMVSLITKEAAPRVRIYARAEHKDLMKRLKKAGADVVVLPEVTGAEELFSHITGKSKTLSSLHV